MAQPSALDRLMGEREIVHAKPGERAVIFTDRAEAALDEVARKLDDPARVAALADRFELLVKEALLGRAHEVPPADREAVLGKLAARFRNAESKASRLAGEAKLAGRHATTVSSLTRIATTAHTADLRLRDLAARRA